MSTVTVSTSTTLNFMNVYNHCFHEAEYDS